MLRNRHLLLVLSTLMFVISLPACRKYYMEHPPVANAGHSDTITLPLDSVRLSGSGTSTNGPIVTYLWSQLSGPSSATIVHPDSASTWATGLVAGSYTFQLMVTDDKGISGTDTTTVLVQPSAYHTLILQPANNPNEIMMSFYRATPNVNVDSNFTDAHSFFVEAGTVHGDAWIVRALLKFDSLSTIPSTATIVSASLYLYSNPTPAPLGDSIHANAGKFNSFGINSIAKPWSADTLGMGHFRIPWNSPISVLLPATSQPFLDLNIDVTALVHSMVNNNANYGFAFQLPYEVDSDPVNTPLPWCRIFVSSYNTTYPDKHPKLVVVYK